MSQLIPSMSSRDLRWLLSNGQSINDLRFKDTASKPLISSRNNAMAAYDNYFTLKRSYQPDLPEFVMEQTLDQVASGSTKASGPTTASFRS